MNAVETLLDLDHSSGDVFFVDPIDAVSLSPVGPVWSPTFFFNEVFEQMDSFDPEGFEDFSAALVAQFFSVRRLRVEAFIEILDSQSDSHVASSLLDCFDLSVNEFSSHTIPITNSL